MTVGLAISSGGPLRAEEPAPVAATPAESSEGHGHLSNAEIAQQLANPISNLYSLQLQNNLVLLKGDGNATRGSWTSNFQPALPLHLTDDWNLIVRPVFSFMSTPHQDLELGLNGPHVDFDRANGIGQTSVISLLSPRKSKTLWGVGPSFIIPTTTRDELSQRKYAWGPAGVILESNEKWTYGLFPQYWWSFSGSDKHPEISQGNLQYFIWRSIGNGWQVGTAPNITYNRKSKGGDAWQVPLGIGVQKVHKFGKMPVRFTLEYHYYVVHTDDYGPRMNFRFAITPVIQAIFKDNIF